MACIPRAARVAAATTTRLVQGGQIRAPVVGRGGELGRVGGSGGLVAAGAGSAARVEGPEQVVGPRRVAVAVVAEHWLVHQRLAARDRR